MARKPIMAPQQFGDRERVWGRSRQEVAARLQANLRRERARGDCPLFRNRPHYKELSWGAGLVPAP